MIGINVITWFSFAGTNENRRKLSQNNYSDFTIKYKLDAHALQIRNVGSGLNTQESTNQKHWVRMSTTFDIFARLNTGLQQS
jgi:hypothetical protein